MAWRILVFYIGSLSVIIAVVPWTSAALSSPFAAVLEAARIPGAATAITLIAVIALLSALNANLYGASRMIHSLAAARRSAALAGAGQPPPCAGRWRCCRAWCSVSSPPAMELRYPGKVLPVLLNVVGSTCLLVWTISLLSQLILRRRADRDGTRLPFRMRGFPYLTVIALAILGLIFLLLLSGTDTRIQFLSMLGLTLGIAAVSEIARRRRA